MEKEHLDIELDLPEESQRKKSNPIRQLDEYFFGKNSSPVKKAVGLPLVMISLTALGFVVYFSLIFLFGSAGIMLPEGESIHQNDPCLEDANPYLGGPC